MSTTYTDRRLAELHAAIAAGEQAIAAEVSDLADVLLALGRDAEAEELVAALTDRQQQQQERVSHE